MTWKKVFSRLRTIVVLLLVIGAISWLYDATGNRRYLQRVYVDLQDQYDVVAFGDSLTEGIGATQSRGYITLLSERLNLDILNKGIRRDKTSDLVGRVDRDVIAYRPKLVIMTGGGNDMARAIPWDQTESNLRELFTLFQSKNIYVLYLGVKTARVGDKYQSRLQALTDEFPNVTYISRFMDGVMFNRGLTFDFVHPDDAGHALIADRLQPIVMNLLTELDIPYENESITLDPSIAQ